MQAVLVAACGPGEARSNAEPVPVAASVREVALAVPPGPAPSLSATALPAAATASASATPPPDRPSTRTTRPPGADKVRWQRIFDIYGHLLDMDAILDDYHRRYPDKTELVTLGTSHQGRPVKALLIANHPAQARSRPSVLLNGAHHGDEPLSSAIVLDAVEMLLSRSDSDPRIQRYLSELAIWCVPLVNPDGLAAFFVDFGAGRKNGRETRGKDGNKTLNQKGVDLNRNYPFRWGSLKEVGSRSRPEARNYRGPEAGSEPETKAMVALSEREHFVASLSYHIGTVALLAPYTIDGVPNPKPNEAWLVAEEVVKHIPKIHGRPMYVRKNLYPVDGTDQDYHRGAHGTLALLIEGAARSWESKNLEQKAVADIRPSWGALFDRYLDGPSVEGHVKDEKGRPVAADVRVVEMPTGAGESWKSRCPDGFFGRYLPGFGSFTVRVTPAGGAPVDTTVEVAKGKGRVAVDIVVSGANGADAGACPAPAE